MAFRGPFFLAICFAWLLTVRALQCHSNFVCTPKGKVCEKLAPSSNVTSNSAKCGSNVKTCSLTMVTVGTKGKGLAFDSEAKCGPTNQSTPLKTGCFGRKELMHFDPAKEAKLKELEQEENFTINSVSVCICDENLCNSSIKSAASVSAIISSIMMSFMLFM